jgi:hypothetical protein
LNDYSRQFDDPLTTVYIFTTPETDCCKRARASSQAH